MKWKTHHLTYLEAPLTLSIDVSLNGSNWKNWIQHRKWKKEKWNKHTPHTHTAIAVDRFFFFRYYCCEKNTQTYECGSFNRSNPTDHFVQWIETRWSNVRIRNVRLSNNEPFLYQTFKYQSQFLSQKLWEDFTLKCGAVGGLESLQKKLFGWDFLFHSLLMIGHVINVQKYRNSIS